MRGYLLLMGVAVRQPASGCWPSVLMAECLHRSRLRAASALGLHTTGLMAVARGIYERIGFVRVPEFDFQPEPGVVVMAYRLDL